MFRLSHFNLFHTLYGKKIIYIEHIYLNIKQEKQLTMSMFILKLVVQRFEFQIFDMEIFT